MPLKDYKEEVRCVSVVAGLLKQQAGIKSQQATLNMAFALKDIIKKCEDKDVNAEILDKTGVVWGA